MPGAERFHAHALPCSPHSNNPTLPPRSRHRLGDCCAQGEVTGQQPAGVEPGLPACLCALPQAPSLLQANRHCHLVLTVHSLHSSRLGWILELTDESGTYLLPPVTRDNSSTTFLLIDVHWAKLFPASKWSPRSFGGQRVRRSQGCAIVRIRSVPQRPSWCRLNFKALGLLRSGGIF